MRRQAVCGVAAALAVLTGTLMVSAAGTVRAADCWLLDDTALEEVQEQGRCDDAFSRHAAPAVKPVPVPAAKPEPPRKAKAARRASKAKAKPAPDPLASLERFLSSAKPAQGSLGRSRNGGIDHLAYGHAGRPAHR